MQAAGVADGAGDVAEEAPGRLGSQGAGDDGQVGVVDDAVEVAVGVGAVLGGGFAAGAGVVELLADRAGDDRDIVRINVPVGVDVAEELLMRWPSG
ncbi:MAG: hypothetical protein H6813_07755 [Phycisphaeraceae bacterium]|nr:hypothetical protein [Phycisphaeraceae bacterium]MCB9848391.1 hypothetical protein [Phycisphaeraceae bacterium]